MRRTELALVLAFLAILVIAALAGIERAPPRDLTDRRLSTLLHGPRGASGLAEALDRLDVPVERLDRPLFGLDTVAVDPGALLLLLDLTTYPTEAEERALVIHLERGGRIFSVGRNGWERCLGYRISRLGRARGDSARPSLPAGIDTLPDLSAVLVRIQEDTVTEEDRAETPSPGDCPRLVPSRVDTLLAAPNGRPFASTLEFESGGIATLVGDPALFRNRSLRQTDAGVLALSWLMATDPDRVLIDEYHHGFGRGGSIWSFTWGWLRENPVGWALLQLCAAALLAIGFAAVRFGPPVHVVRRTRRSAIEHLDALATGLERAGAAPTAIALIVRGLHRRLAGRSDAAHGGTAEDAAGWLEGWARTAPTERARRHAAELQRLAGAAAPDEETVLNVATTAEELWEALGERKPHV